MAGRPVMPRTVSVAEAKKHFGEVVKEAEERLERTIVTKAGKPVAVVVGYEDYESWQETLEILASPGWLREIKEAERQLARGKAVAVDEIVAAGRRKR
jgi:prevent-host-death family protein